MNNKRTAKHYFTTSNKLLSPERHAKLLLFKAGELNGSPSFRYLGVAGGDHCFMVGGNYFSVDLVIGKVWRTA